MTTALPSGVAVEAFAGALDGLAGITGTGGTAIDADGTHRIWSAYEVEPG